MTTLEEVAKAIYSSAFDARMSPGAAAWSWDKASRVQRDFCTRQAEAAMNAIGCLDPDDQRTQKCLAWYQERLAWYLDEEVPRLKAEIKRLRKEAGG
jgi:hypothetical protein